MIRNLLTTVLAFFIGAFTLAFTAVVGVVMALVAIIAKPFVGMWVKKKVSAYQEAAGFSAADENTSSRSQGRTIDGEYEDITAR